MFANRCFIDCPVLSFTVGVQAQNPYSIMAGNGIPLSNSFFKKVMILRYLYDINFSPIIKVLKIIKVLNIISLQVTLILSGTQQQLYL